MVVRICWHCATSEHHTDLATENNTHIYSAMHNFDMVHIIYNFNTFQSAFVVVPFCLVVWIKCSLCILHYQTGWHIDRTKREKERKEKKDVCADGEHRIDEFVFFVSSILDHDDDDDAIVYSKRNGTRAHSNYFVYICNQYQFRLVNEHVYAFCVFGVVPFFTVTWNCNVISICTGTHQDYTNSSRYHLKKEKNQPKCFGEWERENIAEQGKRASEREIA